MSKNANNSSLATNKKAYHEYEILTEYEAGIELHGTEVKSIRAGKMNLKESIVKIMKNEVYLINCHVSPYEQGNIFNKDPLRPRRLLMHKREINKLYAAMKQDGLAIIPLSVYFNESSRVKLEIGVCKGKRLYDKRDAAAAKDAKREIDRNMKQRF